MKSLQSYLKDIESLCIVGPLYEGTYDAIEEYDHIVFVDGGARFKKDKGFSVGDNDSSDRKLDFVLNKEKDFSDFSFVLQNIPKSIENIRLFGFEKGRLDHELFNLGELFYFLQNTSARVVSDGFTGFAKGQNELELNGLFSVVCFAKHKLSILGKCRYPIENTRSFRVLDSNLLSNKGYGKVKFISDQPLFVLFDQLN